MRSVVVAIVAVASVLLLGACGEEKDTQRGKVTVSGGKMRFKDPKTGEEVEVALPKPSRGTGEDETVPEATWHVKSKEGEATISAGGAAKIPATFPKDVPLYPGAQVLMAAETPQGTMVQLRTKDDAKKVSSAYAAVLKAQGWEEETSATMPTGTMFALKKGGRTLQVMVLGTDDVTTIQLVAPKEKPQAKEE
ncbi:MAG: hypothetical protein FJ290_11855 [Planctomycetes bacterium]|nr:hypothetical protein [Planctomycetota bacterium]